MKTIPNLQTLVYQWLSQPSPALLSQIAELDPETASKLSLGASLLHSVSMANSTNSLSEKLSREWLH